jgi:hypothetical protein
MIAVKEWPVIRFVNACFASNMPPQARLTLIALAHFADPDGGKVRPSVGTVAALTGQSERTTQHWMRWLHSEGVIEVTKEAGRTSPVEYRIHIDRIPTDERQTDYQLHLLDRVDEISVRRERRNDPFAHVYRTS